jgi:hypothetical protein
VTSSKLHFLRAESSKKTSLHRPRVNTSVADPGFGAFFDPSILDSGQVNKSRSGFGMNTRHQISESLETICWIKILKIFLTLETGRKNLDLGSGINIPDPQIRNTGQHRNAFGDFEKNCGKLEIRSHTISSD